VEDVGCCGEQDNDQYLDEMKYGDDLTRLVELHSKSANNDFKNVIECMGMDNVVVIAVMQSSHLFDLIDVRIIMTMTVKIMPISAMKISGTSGSWWSKKAGMKSAMKRQNMVGMMGAKITRVIPAIFIILSLVW
jgi:hypothetical protein